MSQPSPAEIAYQVAHMRDDRRTGIAVTNGVCLGVAVTAVLLRLWSRRLVKAKSLADDWWIWLLFILFIAAIQVLAHFGLGRHSILITNPKGFILSALVAGVLHHFTIFAVKVSILCFYRRLFPHQWFRYTLLATGAAIGTTSIVIILKSTVPCLPISFQSDPASAHGCLFSHRVILASGIINFVTDLIPLILPMPILYQMNISKSQRRMVMSTFLLGGLVCVTSFARIFFIASPNNSDASWGNTVAIKLTSIEIGIGILSACLPCFRPIIIYFFPNSSISNSVNHVSGNKGMRLPVIENKSNMRSETTETEDDETLCTGSGKNPSIVGDVEALSQEGTK